MPNIEFHPFNNAYQGLLDTMNNTFNAKTNSYSVLLGPPGMGKSSALYYAYLNCSHNSVEYFRNTILPAAREATIKKKKKDISIKSMQEYNNLTDGERAEVEDFMKEEDRQRSIRRVALIEIDALVLDSDSKILDEIKAQMNLHNPIEPKVQGSKQVNRPQNK
jgi:hypothetical protein